MSSASFCRNCCWAEEKGPAGAASEQKLTLGKLSLGVLRAGEIGGGI